MAVAVGAALMAVGAALMAVVAGLVEAQVAPVDTATAGAVVRAADTAAGIAAAAA
ncbi:MAG TPA: hypothetical protein VFC19_04085 [Candidatus Limnocylindrales bacterium]|nr:hypothetical protein [Candidatus Limnocylindrales bacterium]